MHIYLTDCLRVVVRGCQPAQENVAVRTQRTPLMVGVSQPDRLDNVSTCSWMVSVGITEHFVSDNRLLESVPTKRDILGRRPILRPNVGGLLPSMEGSKNMPQTFWKIILGLVLVGGCLFLLSAGLLAATIHSLDLQIRDRYFVILPSRLLLVSALLFIATFIVWKARISH